MNLPSGLFKVISFPLRVNTRRAAGRACLRVSTLSCQKRQRLSLLKVFLICRARWDEGRQRKAAAVLEHLNIQPVWFQTRYKESGRKGGSSSLYSLLPETIETVRAKEVSELCSEVKHRWRSHWTQWNQWNQRDYPQIWDWKQVSG